MAVDREHELGARGLLGREPRQHVGRGLILAGTPHRGDEVRADVLVVLHGSPGQGTEAREGARRLSSSGERAAAGRRFGRR